MEECLLVGGPWDGHRRNVHSDMRDLNMPEPLGPARVMAEKGAIPTAKACSNFLYVRTILAGPERRYSVFVYNDHQQDVIGALIAGYRAPKDS